MTTVEGKTIKKKCWRKWWPSKCTSFAFPGLNPVCIYQVGICNTTQRSGLHSYRFYTFHTIPSKPVGVRMEVEDFARTLSMGGSLLLFKAYDGILRLTETAYCVGATLCPRPSTLHNLLPYVGPASIQITQFTGFLEASSSIVGRGLIDLLPNREAPRSWNEWLKASQHRQWAMDSTLPPEKDLYTPEWPCPWPNQETSHVSFRKF